MCLILLLWRVRPDYPCVLENLAHCLQPDGTLYLGVNGAVHLSNRIRKFLPAFGFHMEEMQESAALRKILSLGDADELRAGRAVGQVIGDVGHQVEQTNRVGRIDLVPGIAGLVIIRVQPGEEEQHGHLFGGERSVVARAVARFGIIDAQSVLGRYFFK